jgi:hypothetical protein
MEATGETLMTKKKPLVDNRYKLCQGCNEYWHLKTDYQCEKCHLVCKANDAWQFCRTLLWDLRNLDFGIKERPMIERE